MYIYKVIQNFQDVNNMEEINKITGLDPFESDNWCDLSEFEEHPELKEYLSEEEFEALKKGQTDYIAFKIDR